MRAKVLAQKPCGTRRLPWRGGGVFAATTDGNLVRIDRHGQVTPLPDQGKITGKTPASPIPSGGRASLLIVGDVSGNRYQLDPVRGVILK